jgi:nucleoside-diphosphate-sugar epimerase
MRILVTGGAGFIGSHIVEALLQRGDSVRVLDDFSSGFQANLEPFHGDLEVIAGDLRDRNTVTHAVAGVDLVFHLAAFVSVLQSMQDPETCFAVNVAGTLNLMEASRKAGVRRMVISSSTAVYGDTSVFPTGEQVPPAPLSPYAVSKQVNELYARLYSGVLDLPVVSLRYFNVYGPRQRPDSDYAAAIPIFIRRMLAGEPLTIYGNGKQSRDFIFVKDVVKANLIASEVGAAGEVFNICTGRETNLLDLMEELSGLSTDQPVVEYAPPRAGDIYRSVGDPEKAEKMIGFKAETPLAEGLSQTIAWTKNK